MASNVSTSVTLKEVFLAIFLLVLIVFSFSFIDKMTNEDRDYLLSEEMHKLAGELKAYKQKNGLYPETLSAVRNSDKLCVTYLYKKCKQVHYKPSPDRQDFRMAVHSFTWIILFYHPQVSVSLEEFSKLSDEEQESWVQQAGSVCFFCMSYPPGRTDLQGADSSTPIYRETAPIFANPAEWPEL